MARPRVRRKTKNPSSKVSKKQKNPYDISFHGVHPLIKKNWNKDLTLKQNYTHLGLISVVNGQAGGKGPESTAYYSELKNKLSDKVDEELEWRVLSEVSSADPSSQKINQKTSLMEIEPPKFIDDRVTAIGSKLNLKKLRDFRLDISTTSTDIVQMLEKEASQSIKMIRSVSNQEELFLTQLENKYGDNYERMSLDKKLNPYLLTPGQLRKKMTRMHLKRKGVDYIQG